jgi:hypothetical protein
MSYDAWKCNPDEPDEECWHEDYEADVNGHATCCRCGDTWYLSDEEIAAERAHVAAYDAMCRREERRERWARVTAAIRRLLPKRRPEPINDEVPF